MIWTIFIGILKKCKTDKERKISILFDDVIADMLSNKKLNEFIRGRKLNISLVFITKSYFAVQKILD